MKKIFAIALAVVMVLSMASAFAVIKKDCVVLDFTYDCETEDTWCGQGKVEVVPYVKVNTACGWEYQVSDCASAIRSENVYFAIKVTAEAYPDPAWWSAAWINLETEGLNLGWDFDDDTQVNHYVSSLYNQTAFDQDADEEKVYYVNEGLALVDSSVKGFSIDSVMHDAKVNEEDDCANTEYGVCAKLLSYNSGIGVYEYAGYLFETTATYLKITKKSTGEVIAFSDLDQDGVIDLVHDGAKNAVDPDFYAEVTSKFNLGCGIGTCINAKNWEKIFGWDFEQIDCFDWSTKGASVVDTDCVVAIPKTGDASVLAWLF